MASSDGVQSYVDSPGAAPSGEKPPEMSLETNEDSSYDSDFETDETGVSTSVGAHQNISRSSSAGCSTHHDVSRTVSDTLAAEFAEYVSADHKSYPDPTKAPGYAARVEFAVKLGYTEKLVLAALQKLGPEPIQNELLGELIKLSAKNQKTPDSPSSFVDTVASVSVAAPAEQLRPIVIDGSNVAMSHGNKEYFSCRGIKICVDWFRARGHKEITVFVPKWRKEASRPDNPIADQEILNELEKERFLVFTPSRQLGGKRMTCYDDRYILKLAAEVDGIVVSNDNYRDLMPENPEFKKIVEERILMFSFVNDLFMPPDDPLGRSGPTLGNFLRVTQKRGEPPPPCPYGKKCTYGNKCKFHHPERGNMPHKSVTEKLSEHAQKHSQGRENTEASSLKTFSLPLNYEHQAVGPRKTPLGRARSAAPAPPPMDPHSVITHFNRAQQEYQQSIKTPPKSRSIENITSGVMEMNIAGPSHLPTQRCAQNTPYTHTPPMWGSMMLNEPNWMYQEEPQESANRHRKLHRQLTLNPNYDPRLFRMPGYVGPPNVNGPGPSWGAMQAQQAHQAQHETVARIASAPASSSYLHCPVEPQLPPPPQLQQTWPWAEHPDRSRVHFHLSSLFPEEQVQKAMALFPDDTHPKEICAAILNMFHKS